MTVRLRRADPGNGVVSQWSSGWAEPGWVGDAISPPLPAAQRVIARVKGISSLAEAIGMTRQGRQRVLPAKGNPRLDTINAILRAMGYYLLPHRSEIYRRDHGLDRCGPGGDLVVEKVNRSALICSRQTIRRRPDVHCGWVRRHLNAPPICPTTASTTRLTPCMVKADCTQSVREFCQPSRRLGV